LGRRGEGEEREGVGGEAARQGLCARESARVRERERERKREKTEREGE